MSQNLQKLLERWIRPGIRQLSAYHVAEAGNMVKLDAMENPYPWPPQLVDAWLECLRQAPLNRYPDPAATELVQSLRPAMGVPPFSDVLLGNGSDEIIQMILMAVSGEGRVVLAPEPTFVMYRMIAAFTGMQYHGVPLRGDFSLDADAVCAAIEQTAPAVVFLACPNNPTGNLFEAGALEQVLQAAPGLVVIDEAYAPFADRQHMEWLARYEQLLVMRTVSKQGLAGLRLGLLAGAPALIEEINKVRLPYNINVLTQASARFALSHIEVLNEQARCIRRDREALATRLAALEGLTVYPSQANFILFRTAPGRATDIFAGLRQGGVLIKNLDSTGPLQDCLRVTVGTPEENAKFLSVLESLLA